MHWRWRFALRPRRLRPPRPARRSPPSKSNAAAPSYNQNCQECHGSTLDNGEFGGPPLKGGYFTNHWGAGSVADLTGYAKALMPPDRPGRLSDQTYTDVIAYLLSNNGYAPDGKELPSDLAAQQKMSLKK